MSLKKFLDEQIRKAMAEGRFDNLRGAGKPLNSDDYFAAPANIPALVTVCSKTTISSRRKSEF